MPDVCKQFLHFWRFLCFVVLFLQFSVGSPPGNENMVNTSIYLQSVFIPGAALLALFLPAFLSLPVFNQLCLLSRAWKVDNCLGSVNCWQPQPLISNKCFKMAGNFSTISSLLYLYSFYPFRSSFSTDAFRYHISLKFYLPSVLKVGQIKFWQIVATNRKDFFKANRTDFFKTSHNSNFSNSLKKTSITI